MMLEFLDSVLGQLRPGHALRESAHVELHQKAALPSIVARALKIIREESAGPLTRAEVARKAGVSPSHLAGLLQERTGRSFTELVREARIERACELLRTSDHSMAAIADECGFCDQSYFTHVFLKIKKSTPKQYRDGVPRAPKKNPPGAAAP